MLAASRPIIVLINDLHWAEKTFLDLLVSVLETARAPIVLVGSARHDLIEEYPDWDTPRARARSLPLDPLTGDESEQVIANLLGTTAIDASIRERIVKSAQGNPLFVEQMLSMLIDDGLVAQENGHWTVTGDLMDVIVPPSISALLSARLDRLPDGRAVRPGARLGHRPRLLAGGHHRPQQRLGDSGGPAIDRVAAQAARGADDVLVPERAGVPVPAHPHP